MFKILLVEDDQHFRKIFKQELSQAVPEIRIDEASGGKEALEKVNSFCPQVIFMDIRLPDGSGLQLTRKIKASCPDIEVVMLTSHDLPEYRKAAEEYGARHFFVKGSSGMNEIKILVESLLSKEK